MLNSLQRMKSASGGKKIILLAENGQAYLEAGYPAMRLTREKIKTEFAGSSFYPDDISEYDGMIVFPGERLNSGFIGRMLHSGKFVAAVAPNGWMLAGNDTCIFAINDKAHFNNKPDNPYGLPHFCDELIKFVKKGQPAKIPF